jgi:lipoate-protein ligase A
MTVPCRVLPYEVADGPANMALDEAMLDAVAGGAEIAFLRTYGWSAPTLSVGYFQHLADFEAEPRWHGVSRVRRCTGGGAICHHHEVTYALVVPASHRLARPNTRLYRAVHAAIAEVLERCGVRALPRGDIRTQRHCDQKRAVLCFEDSSPEDVITDGVKIVGSAQRRREGAVLQHGSLLLARAPLAPELAGLCDVADVSCDPKAWSDRLLEGVPAALELDPLIVAGPDTALRARARELERRRYRDPAWTAMR